MDWDQKHKISKYESLFNKKDLIYYKEPFKCLVWPEEKCNGELDKSFGGIERYYPTRIIKKGIRQGLDIGYNEQKGKFFTNRQDYKNIKAELAKLIPDYLELKDIQSFKGFLLNVFK